jgi:hypothetical protein
MASNLAPSLRSQSDKSIGQKGGLCAFACAWLVPRLEAEAPQKLQRLSGMQELDVASKFFDS